MRDTQAHLARLLALATLTPALLAAVVGFTAIICDIALKYY